VNTESESSFEPSRKRKGILARHPRLGLMIIGALFILPLCAMMITVAVFILMKMLNAQ
jgi:hypothetical protein